MPDIEGKYASTSLTHLVDGKRFNAGLRIFDNSFDLSADGGGTDPFVLGKVREGNKPQQVLIRSDQNLSAINFTVGTAADPDAYGTAQAGPNATKKELLLTLAADAGDALSSAETIILTPSANMPGAGTLVTKLITSKQ